MPTFYDGLLYCGITAYDNDILHAFDPKTEQFRSMGYAKVAEKFEVKIHRSLELSKTGVIYGASACLYGLDERLQAPGGSIFSFDPRTRTICKLGIPVPYDYIQTITLDENRGLLYGLTYPVFQFFVYDMQTKQTTNFSYIGSITHISALDDEGGFWGTWHNTQHYLFRYDPDQKTIRWFRHGLPDGTRFANRMYPGAGPVDCMINGGDGYIYIGTTGGTLCRLDPKTAQVKDLGRPANMHIERLPAIVVLDERLLLCVGGDEKNGALFLYDRKTGQFDTAVSIKDDQTGLYLYRVHDCSMTDKNTIYVAETDVPDRSGYLWECKVKIG